MGTAVAVPIGGKTAHRVAVRRASHQIWDGPRIFDDPLALKILDVAEAAEIAATKPSNSLPSNSLRAFIVARSRYAEGDHVIFVGEVERCERRVGAQPLIFHGGRYFTELPL